jgi:hypothetical protein
MQALRKSAITNKETPVLFMINSLNFVG